jgi:hypothetical protein
LDARVGSLERTTTLTGRRTAGCLSESDRAPRYPTEKYPLPVTNVVKVYCADRFYNGRGQHSLTVIFLPKSNPATMKFKSSHKGLNPASTRTANRNGSRAFSLFLFRSQSDMEELSFKIVKVYGAHDEVIVRSSNFLICNRLRRRCSSIRTIIWKCARARG